MSCLDKSPRAARSLDFWCGSAALNWLLVGMAEYYSGQAALTYLECDACTDLTK